jgi:hypothetical protein
VGKYIQWREADIAEDFRQPQGEHLTGACRDLALETDSFLNLKPWGHDLLQVPGGLDFVFCKMGHTLPTSLAEEGRTLVKAF